MAPQNVKEKWPFVINLGNSIIGVALLAMPFCFKQCGMLLGILVLLFCTWLTLASCQLLMKAGVVSHHRSYEYLAYHTYGAPGKFLVEIGMIGIQLGTLVAQIVVIGDLGPTIFSHLFGFESTSLRLYLIVFLCLCVGLPLGLMKDMRNVNRASTVCMAFYAIFCAYILWMSLDSLLAAEWYSHISWWEPQGLFQCLPIMSFCFGCQTQLFHLYDALPEPSLHAIKSIIHTAVNLCTVAYLMVGFLGYITFYHIEIPGDILTKFPSTLGAHLMKLGFVISIAITFPVIIFPCRASIYTLLFQKKVKHSDDVVSSYIPEVLFKSITVVIVIGSMVTGILIPNVEFILGINGAITGTLICYIFPALFFLRVMSSKAEGKTIAQIVLVLGVSILLVSTYSTLSSQDKSHVHGLKKPLEKKTILGDTVNVDNGKIPDFKESGKDLKRMEPPNPHDPDSDHKLKVAKMSDSNKGDGAVGDANTLNKEDAGKGKVEENKVEEIKQIEEDGERNKRRDELLGALELQRKEQQQLLEQQKVILQELKEHKEKDHEGWMAMQNQHIQNNNKEVQQAPEAAQPQGGAVDPSNLHLPLQPSEHETNNPGFDINGPKQAVIISLPDQNQAVNNLALGQNHVANNPVVGEKQAVNNPVINQNLALNNPVLNRNEAVNNPVLSQNAPNKQIMGQNQVFQIQAIKNPTPGQNADEQNKAVFLDSNHQPFIDNNQAVNNLMIVPSQSVIKPDTGKEKTLNDVNVGHNQIVEQKQGIVNPIPNSKNISNKAETRLLGEQEQDGQQLVVQKDSVKVPSEVVHEIVMNSNEQEARDLLKRKRRESDADVQGADYHMLTDQQDN